MVQIHPVFQDEDNQMMVSDLMTHIQPVAPEQPAKDSAVSGKTVVFTGTLSKLSRNEAKAQLNVWARVSGSISKNRLSGCQDAAGSKLTRRASWA